jgi:hypothetical protein
LRGWNPVFCATPSILIRLRLGFWIEMVTNCIAGGLIGTCMIPIGFL